MKLSMGFIILLLAYSASAAPIIESGSRPTEDSSLQAGIYLDTGLIAAIIIITLIVFALIGMADQQLTAKTTSQDTSLTRSYNCCDQFFECFSSFLSCCCNCLMDFCQACDHGCQNCCAVSGSCLGI